jgi:hypothetical protein
MPEHFPHVRDGDALTPAHLNVIYRELDRWRKLTGSGSIAVTNADSREPPVIVDQDMAGFVPADSGSGFAAGSRAAPTTATVTLMTPTAGAAGLTMTNGRIVTAYNTYPTAIPASKTVWLTTFFGKYYIVQAEC